METYIFPFADELDELFFNCSVDPDISSKLETSIQDVTIESDNLLDDLECDNETEFKSICYRPTLRCKYVNPDEIIIPSNIRVLFSIL